MKNILAKLHAIMSEVDFIEKDARNDFHKYAYASEYAIKKTIHPLLVKHKVLFSVNIEDMKREDNITTSRILYSFIDVESGEQFDGTFYGSGEDKGDKGLYKSLTGAIKYILTSSFLIPTGDDPERDDPTRSPAVAPKSTSKADDMHNGAYAILKDKIAAENDFGKLEQFKASLMEKSDIVTPLQYKDLISRIDKKIKKENLKETKQDARQAAELETQDIESIQVEE